MSFKLTLIILNVIAVAVTLAVVFWYVGSKKRNPESEPANLTPFLPDEQLEGRRLERVLATSLISAAIMLIALLAYFIWEPWRTEAGTDQFLERSIERGATLFANDQMDEYQSEFSLLCADCHGEEATGGTEQEIIESDLDECQQEENQGNVDVPQCLPIQVTWSAPDLTRASLIYSRAQLIDIITYGRPGTPMPAWGVKSGEGAKNAQSINDLVNYITSLAMTSEEATQQSTEAIDTYRDEAEAKVTDLQAAVDESTAALTAAQADPATSEDDLEVLTDELELAQEQLALATAYRDDVATLSDGAILFRLNCARCHTKGWSYFENEPERVDLPVLPPQGSGAYGPNLTGGAVLLQFPGKSGLLNQVAWVTDGVPANRAYGARGISSGRMPHFGSVLTKAQIRAIVDYERELFGDVSSESAGGGSSESDADEETNA